MLCKVTLGALKGASKLNVLLLLLLLCQQWIRHAIPQKILTCQTFRRGVFERRRRKHRRSQACHITRPRLVADPSKSCTIRKFVCDERIGAKSG